MTPDSTVTVTMTPGRPPGSPGDGSPAQGITARPRLRAWPRPLGWELAIRAWAPLQYLHVFVCIIAILYVCRMYMSVCVCILNHLGEKIAKYEMSYRMYVACMLYHDSVVTDRLSDGQFGETLQLLPYQGFERRNKCTRVGGVVGH